MSSLYLATGYDADKSAMINDDNYIASAMFIYVTNRHDADKSAMIRDENNAERHSAGKKVEL